jgi:hypothetical protein
MIPVVHIEAIEAGLAVEACPFDGELAAALLPHRPPLLWEKCPTCDCRTRRPGRPCWRCRRAAMVPGRSKFARRGAGVGNGGYQLPAGPTSAFPGSSEKVAVLEERARLGLALWHPGDAR